MRQIQSKGVGTRWASRKRAVSSLIGVYEFAFEELAYINKNDKSASASNADSLLIAIQLFEIQFVLRTLHEAFQRTGALSDALQLSALEMDRCKRLVSSTVNALKSIRTGNFLMKYFKLALNSEKKAFITNTDSSSFTESISSI